MIHFPSNIQTKQKKRIRAIYAIYEDIASRVRHLRRGEKCELHKENNNNSFHFHLHYVLYALSVLSFPIEQSDLWIETRKYTGRDPYRARVDSRRKNSDGNFQYKLCERQPNKYV